MGGPVYLPSIACQGDTAPATGWLRQVLWRLPVLPCTDLLRTPLLRSWVNKGKKKRKGRNPDIGPRPVGDNRLTQQRLDSGSMSVRGVIVVALGELNEHARFFAYTPRIMTRW
jgi:hypothetical protein